MIKYAIDENGYIIGSEGVIDYYMLIDKPIPNNFVKWDFDLNDWVFDLDAYKNERINYVKFICSEVITDEQAFPTWRQNNLMNDYNYALYALSTAIDLTPESIIKSIVNILGLTRDVDELKTYWNDAYEQDYTNIIDPSNPIIPESIQLEYCVILLKSTISYRLMKLVRDWSNAKEVEINNCTTKEEIDNLSYNDYPNINVY